MWNKTSIRLDEETGSVRNKSFRKLHLFLGVSLLFLGLMIIFSGVRSLTDNKIRAFAPKGFVTLEVVDTEAERIKGLMDRKELGKNEGMLFVFDNPQDAGCFWMKNTYIALDMIWLDENKKVIHVHENATPLSEERICPDQNGAYVIEVNAGRAKELGFTEGATVRF